MSDDQAETLADAAARWAVSAKFLRSQIAQRRLPAYRAGRAIRVKRADVDALFTPANPAISQEAGKES